MNFRSVNEQLDKCSSLNALPLEEALCLMDMVGKDVLAEGLILEELPVGEWKRLRRFLLSLTGTLNRICGKYSSTIARQERSLPQKELDSLRSAEAKLRELEEQEPGLHAEFRKLKEQEPSLRAEIRKLEEQESGLRAEIRKLKEQEPGLRAEIRKLEEQESGLRDEKQQLESIVSRQKLKDQLVTQLLGEKQDLEQRVSRLKSVDLTRL